MKIIKKIKLKIVIFTAAKNRCILHGHVCVMFWCYFYCVNDCRSSLSQVLSLLRHVCCSSVLALAMTFYAESKLGENNPLSGQSEGVGGGG